MYDPTKPYNDLIDSYVKKTLDTKYVKILNGFTQRKFSSPYELSHTDGIGTKGVFHWKHRTFKNAVFDALAMNINDLQMCGAKPFLLLDHIFLPKEDLDAIGSIAYNLSNECIKRNIAIGGGETSIHDNSDALEISITMTGFADEIWTNRFQAGDVLIGLASSGLHSNGFSYVRHWMMNWGLCFSEEWLTPTRIYDIPQIPPIHGIQHITGGAFTKLKKVLHNVDAYIHRNHSIHPQELFHDIYNICKDNSLMYRTFNCGIGMVLAVDKNKVDEVIEKIGGDVIGDLKIGTGKVILESKFSQETIGY